MKILKYLILILLGLVALFFIMGLMKPELHYGHEITVDKSLQEAWAVSQDQSKTSQWIQGLKSEELISGEKGAVGSKYKVTVNPGEGEQDFVMTETITSKKDFEHITMEFDSDMMDFGQTMTFAEKDGKTSIKTESTVKGKGMVMRSMFAVMEMGNSFQKQETKNMEALKKVIDENTTDYFITDSTAIAK